MPSGRFTPLRLTPAIYAIDNHVRQHVQRRSHLPVSEATVRIPAILAVEHRSVSFQLFKAHVHGTHKNKLIHSTYFFGFVCVGNNDVGAELVDKHSFPIQLNTFEAKALTRIERYCDEHYL